MKRSILFFLLFLSFTSGYIIAQDQMAAWQEYMTPGEMHKMLATSVGEWTTKTTMWMDPSQPPMEAEGTAVCKSIMDGKYFQFEHSSSMMGMPYSGLETFGYDNAKKKFFTSYIDNMGTGIMNLEGTYDEATKTITYSGTATDFSGKEMKIRETIKIIDNDNTFLEIYVDQGTGEMKMMETKSTRKKS